MSQPSTVVAALGQGGGDGAARDERHVVLGRRPAEQHRDRRGASHRIAALTRLPAGPVAGEHDLEAQLDAGLARERWPATSSPRRRTSAAVPCLVVDDEVGVLLADHRAADAAALEAELVDDAARRGTVGGVAEDAAGRRQAERLVCLAPAADLVEALGDDRRLGRLEPEAWPRSRLRGASGGAVLEALLAVASAPGRRRPATPSLPSAATIEASTSTAARCPTRGRRRWPTPRRRRCPGWRARTRARRGPPPWSSSPPWPSAGRRRRRAVALDAQRPGRARATTRPPMPASLMTRSEPRPRGRAAGRGCARSGRCRAARTGCGPRRRGRPGRRRASS